MTDLQFKTRHCSSNSFNDCLHSIITFSSWVCLQWTQ